MSIHTGHRCHDCSRDRRDPTGQASLGLQAWITWGAVWAHSRDDVGSSSEEWAGVCQTRSGRRCSKGQERAEGQLWCVASGECLGWSHHPPHTCSFDEVFLPSGSTFEHPHNSSVCSSFVPCPQGPAFLGLCPLSPTSVARAVHPDSWHQPLTSVAYRGVQTKGLGCVSAVQLGFGPKDFDLSLTDHRQAHRRMVCLVLLIFL